MSPQISVRVMGDTIYGESASGAEVHGLLAWSNVHQTITGLFDRWLKLRKLDCRADYEAFGDLLYGMLLDNDVGVMIRHAIDSVDKDPVRIDLDLSAAPKLASLPWEFLHEPRPRDLFYGTDHRVLLTRHLPLPLDLEDLHTAEPTLRVLVVVSSPRELGPIVFQPVVDSVTGLSTSHEVKCTLEENITLARFDHVLSEEQPHLLHYIGHGRFNADLGLGELAFVEDDGVTPRWVAEDDFADLLHGHAPRLVVLQACEGGVVESTTKFSGFAPRILERGVPAVIAMQYPVFNRAATSFATKFYDLLDSNHPIEIAVQGARLAVARSQPTFHSQRDFGAPVLYLRVRDGHVLPRALETADG